MKRLHLINIIALLVAMPAMAQSIKEGVVSIHDVEILRSDKTVAVSMNFDISRLKLKGDETIILTPIIENGEQEMPLPSIEVMGRRAYIHHLRNDKQTVTEDPFYAERVAKRSERKAGKKQMVSYITSVPFEEWMRGATIDIYEGQCACSPVPVRIDEDELAQFLPPLHTPDYRYAFLDPAPEVLKVRQDSFSTYINFRVDKYDILKDYKQNAPKLDSIIYSISKVDKDQDLTITSISINGWASPEATERHNKKLSQNRATSLANYVSRQTGISSSSITATGHGEDWPGLKREVEKATDLMSKDRILAIIDDNSLTLDQKNRKFEELIPATIYERLLKEIYPRLRRNDFRITYNVRNFDLEEARALVDTNPRKLSVSELYMVADSYGKGTGEYNHVMEVAALTYPDNVAAAVNYAAIQLQAGNHDGALATLYKSDLNDSRVLTAMGSVYLAKGFGDEARRMWEKAAAQGNADAQHNLSEMDKYLKSL